MGNMAKYLKYAGIVLLALCLVYSIPAILRSLPKSEFDMSNAKLIFTSISPDKKLTLKVFLGDENALTPQRLLVKTCDKAGNVINAQLFDQNDCDGIAVAWVDLTRADINGIVLDVRNGSYDAGNKGEAGCPAIES